MKPYKSGVRHDYKDLYLAPPAQRRERRLRLFLLGLSLPLVAVSLLLLSERNESKVPAASEADARHSLTDLAVDIPPRLDVLHESAVVAQPASTANELLTLPPNPVESRSGSAARALLEDAAASVLELVVKPGDTLERLFRRNGLSLTDLAAMVSLRDVAEHLRLLRPGDTIRVEHRGGEVLSMVRPIDRAHLLTIERAETGFDAKTIELPVEVKERIAHGEIRTSLFEAGTAAGMSDSLTMTMAGIFQWDIDFILDPRVGDTFTVIYEEHYRDGEKLGDGPIIAAEFVNQGKVYRAARYTDDTGRTDYFTPDGRSVRKAFLRAPVDFTRISSNFDLNRRHPVLNTIRAHKGVDYAAPTGTPVKAAGDGKVIQRGPNGGYGNSITLQHGGNITTLYAHLSRFGQFRVGSRVKQGDIIGYVGATGLATGPHLHYEYRVDGVHRNPRTVPLPPADPVPESSRADFEAKVAVLWERLEQASGPRYADVATD
ncbi:MAG TPA: peptidoglycan DD-metalloendopeptidase family protein [Gammaproteobacteria bacterium]